MPTLIVSLEGHGSKALPMNHSPFVIGRVEQNHLVLEAPNISKHHCHIVQQGGSNNYVIEDLGSSNGTYLDGAKVEAPAPLKNGSRVDLGAFTIVFRLDAREQRGQQGADKEAFLQEQQRTVHEEFKRSIHQELIRRRDMQKLDVLSEGEEEIRNKTTYALREIITRRQQEGELPPGMTPDELLKEMLDLSLGLGPLEDLLADDAVTEVMVNRWDRIFIERSGKITLSDKWFMDDKQVVNVIRRIIAPIGRRIDENTPMCNARLPDGSRVNAVINPVAISGPSISIRKFAKKAFGVQDLVKFEALTEEMAKFIETCVKAKKNLIISGGTGSGKTTLLNLFSTFIPSDERIVTAEDAAELRLQHMNLVSLEAKPANIEGKGAIHIRDLVINSLRMRPDRVIVGECRGGEAFDMVQAMNTGHDGSMTTIHASAPKEAVKRLESLLLMAGFDIPAKAVREQIVAAVRLFVQTLRFSDGSRKVTHITEVQGMKNEEVHLQDIFVYDQQGIDKNGKVLGAHRATGNIPSFYPELVEMGFQVDMDIFY